MKSIHVLLTGGGSGGHTYPLLAVAEALEELAMDKHLFMKLRYLGPRDRYSKILEEIGVTTHSLVSAKLRRYFSFLNLIDIPKFFIGLIEALWKVFWFMPDVIFSKGGPGALPVVIAGWFYRIPILIHESDATPGLTSVLSARFATRIAVGFESAMRFFETKKAALTGNPVRQALLRDRRSQPEAKQELHFDPEKPLLLVLGGSQGAQRINEFVLANLPELLRETQIFHQTGSTHYEEAQKLSRAALHGTPFQSGEPPRYIPVPYLAQEEMKTALTAADLVLARAGAGTIFEIAAFGKPAILIPLTESANNHQFLNAHEFAKSGAAVVVEEENLLPRVFLTQLKTILADESRRAAMFAASGKFFKPEAAGAIASELLKISKKIR